MNPRTLRLIGLFLKLYVLLLLFLPFFDRAFALDEIFETYNSPQGLSMGNAFSAVVNGYASNYYNPAGAAAFNKRKWEVNLVSLEGNWGTGGIGLSVDTQSFGTYRVLGRLKEKPGNYAYFNFATLPSVTFRGVSFAILGNYQFAAESDGTNLDIDTRQDVIPTISLARHFAGNLVAVGISGKAVFRNQLKGVFPHDTIAERNDSTLPGLYKEGYGFGGDFGINVTLPMRFLPTFSFVWKDIFDTRFTSSHFINSQATGSPDKIPQSFNIGFSLEPALSRSFKAVFSAEYSHIELGSRSFRKHTHVGLQLEDNKSLMFWFGLNQFYPTAGVGLRVKGGNIELGSYAEDVGTNDQPRADRRFVFRYTISF